MRIIPGVDRADRPGEPASSRIVVLDGATLDPGDNSFEPLATCGDVEVHDRTLPEQVLERARGAGIVLTNKTVLDAATIASMPELRLVCVLATGVNVVDLAAAARSGVTVCNVPGYAADAVAQHVFALLLEITNAVGQHAAAVRAGEWSRAKDFSFWLRPLAELAGKTIGIVGYGAIGRRVGKMAHAFGLQVLAYSPSRRAPAHYDGFCWSSIAGIFAQSDIVTLHCPLTAENARFVNRELLSTMRDGSILVNTARGHLVDEDALADALDGGRPAFAALDVLSIEPPPPGHRLVMHPRTLVTPHVAWAALAARKRLMDVTVENVRAFLEGRPQNVVGGPASARAAGKTAGQPAKTAPENRVKEADR